MHFSFYSIMACLAPILFLHASQSPKDLDQVLVNIRANMVKVPGGTYQMGCQQARDNACRTDEIPFHLLSISTFYLSKYEVTILEWKSLMPSHVPPSSKYLQSAVEQVSWYEVQQFIQKLNSLNKTQYRLPTEAEWEYAARGGQSTFGYEYAGSNWVSEVAWFEEDLQAHAYQVGQKKPNELGLYDMSGNVWEWCSDWYQEDYYLQSPYDDPQGPASGHYKVARGGSRIEQSQSCRSSFRHGFEPENSNQVVGLRLAASRL